MSAETMDVAGLAEAALGALRRAVGDAWVDVAPANLEECGRNLLPGGDRLPSAIVRPGSTAEVQAVVRVANEHRLALYTTSTGENRGVGLRSAVRPGAVVVDLGARLNRILEIDETLCYAVVEPGVTYAALYEELGRRGHRLQLDVTSGPPNGGILGNTLDKGAGYTPYFDHVYASCGLEVVLPDGRLLRTGDGALPNNRLWHLSKYSFGPQLEGLFLQSNFGIVTRMGVWLMPRPPGLRTFFFQFPDDDDLVFIVDAARELKLSQAVSSTLKVTGDLYTIAAIRTYPFDRTGGVTPLPPAVRAELRAEVGVGAWSVSGALYGPPAVTEAALQQVREVLTRSGKATEVSHAEAVARPELSYHVDIFAGRPTRHELGLLQWRPGGGATWFAPAAPLLGDAANSQQRLARRILTEHGFEYVVEYVCGSRTARGLHLLLYNRADAEERARAAACYRALLASFAAEGYAPGRMGVDMQEEASRYFEGFPAVCATIKRALDPNSVLSPGRYGID